MDKLDDVAGKDLVRELQDERDDYRKKWLVAQSALADELKFGGRMVKFLLVLAIVSSIMGALARSGWQNEEHEHFADRVWWQDRLLELSRGCVTRCGQCGVLP